MKRKFLNKALPAFAIMVAIAGAFAAQSAETKVLAPKTGWINTPTPCAQERVCNTDVGTLCTIRIGSVNHQAFGKLTPTSDCQQVLYMPAQP